MSTPFTLTGLRDALLDQQRFNIVAAVELMKANTTASDKLGQGHMIKEYARAAMVLSALLALHDARNARP